MVAGGATEQNVNGILQHLHQFLIARFRHAKRINPSFNQVEGDLIWHELQLVRKVLGRSKPYAEFRFFVADVLASFDKEKKRGLFHHKDQNCLLGEIVTKAEEIDATKTGYVPIRDMRGLYKTMNPVLDQLVELIQIWIWWDLLDAAELYQFNVQIDRIRSLMSHELNDRLRAYYHNQMRRQGSPETLSREEIIAFEFGRAADLLRDMETRLENEEIHQEIIAYENGEGEPFDEKLLQLADHLRARDRILETHDLPPDGREHYGRTLHCPPSDVTAERALAFEEAFIQGAKRELIAAAESVGAGGTRYNLKQRLLQEARQRLAALRPAQASPESPGARAAHASAP